VFSYQSFLKIYQKSKVYMGLVHFADPGDIEKTMRVFLGSTLAGVLVLLKMPPPNFILLPLHVA